MLLLLLFTKVACVIVIIIIIIIIILILLLALYIYYSSSMVLVLAVLLVEEEVSKGSEGVGGETRFHQENKSSGSRSCSRVGDRLGNSRWISLTSLRSSSGCTWSTGVGRRYQSGSFTGLQQWQQWQTQSDDIYRIITEKKGERE
jgi:hypothetical protein